MSIAQFIDLKLYCWMNIIFLAYSKQRTNFYQMTLVCISTGAANIV